MILFGDCLDLMSSIATGAVDMIFCDLPYGTTHCRWDTPVDLVKLWEQYHRIIKDNGAIVLTAKTPFDKVLGMSNLKNLRYEWIWEKSSATGHLNAKKLPMSAHENVLIFYKKFPCYNPQKTSGHVRKMATAHHKRNSKRGQVYGNYGDVTYDSTERYPRSVLKFPSDKQKLHFHPTQKPVALVEYFINTYSNPGDLILDNCAGSGTTGIACENLGRRYILMENDQEYYHLIKERLNKDTIQK